MKKEELLLAVREHDVLASNPTFQRFIADMKAAQEACFMAAVSSKDINEVLRATGSLSSFRSIQEWFEQDRASLDLQINDGA